MFTLVKIKIILLSLLVCLYAKPYKGAEYRTKSTFTYGRFEVRYKAASGAGQTSTFFTYHELGAEGVSAWNEIDIEILGRYRNDVQFNPITPGQVNHVYHYWVGFDPTEDYHVYAFEWTPDYVAWFIDGKEVHRQTGEHIEALDRSQKIMMNIWPPAYQNWVGIMEAANLPFFAYYDYVSYSSYTPEEGDIGTDNNFTFQWKDNFDSWDKERWAKATHTFVGNNCDFLPANIVFRDGKMVLCLTDNDNTGFVDKNPPIPQQAWYDGEVIKIRFSEEVEKSSAENISNYILRNGGVVNNIVLGNYNREVTLDVSDYIDTTQHDIMITNITDLSETPNASGPKFLDIVNPPVHEYPLKINVGGDATENFQAGQEWSFDKHWGRISGIEGSTTDPISGTELDAVYQTEIRDFVNYKVRVPKGIYNVKLLFSENYFTQNDKRVFDVNIEGNYVSRNLDIFKEVGKNSAYNILAENVEVDDCIINIHFGATQDFAFLHGIEIDQISATTDNQSNNIPESFRLEQNYPNPFNAATTISYHIKTSTHVVLSVFDVRGNIIDALINKKQPAGQYKVSWQPQVASGLYFYRFRVKNDRELFTETKKMLYLK